MEAPGGAAIQEGRGCSSYLLCFLLVFSLKKSTAVAFTVPLRLMSRKRKGRRLCCLELVSLRGEEHLKPHPQNSYLVSPRGSFQDVRRVPLSFLSGSSPQGRKVNGLK